MFWTIPVCLAALWSVGGGGGDEERPQKVRIVCKTDARIRGVDVQLRDLAEVEAADPELEARLLQLSFGRRPAAGFNRILRSREVKLRLMREGLPAGAIELAGAREIVLHPLHTVVRPREILDVAEPILRAVLERESADFEIVPARPVGPYRLPPGRRSFDLRGRLARGSMSRTAATVEVAVLVDDIEYKVLRVPFHVRRFARVLVASRAIRRGEPLGEHNLELRRIEAPHGVELFLTSFDQVRGRVAARDTRAGQRLTLGSATAPAVVRRGDPVTLVSRQGRVQVTTRAIARSDGAVGDRVAVASLASGRVVQAIVLGPGVVTVSPAAMVRGRR